MKFRPFPTSVIPLAGCIACLVILAFSTSAAAQTVAGVANLPGTAGPPRLDPVLTHDERGGVVIRATRITQPLRIDGRMDEPVYEQVAPLTEFIQQVPKPGAPSTEKTEVWVLFDDTNVYITCRCWHEDPSKIVADDMRRDVSSSSHDHIGVLFDTFHDQRTGFLFYLSAIGGFRDALLSDESFNLDWNAVWNSAAARFEGGWIGEMAFPFKTLRYAAGRKQTWGIQFRRGISHSNEFSHITLVPPTKGTGGIMDESLEATLTDIEVPPPALNMEIKPYGLVGMSTNKVIKPPTNNHMDYNGGVDMKYGITKGLTADFTYRTDFAQVEADEAQVNLTRFPVTFPEKRDFFLEGRSIFGFGAGAGGGGSGGATPAIFFTRRIGLSDLGPVPVIGGARLTGKIGNKWSVGLLNMETDRHVPTSSLRTNFSVARVRRDILRRSNVGVILTRRSVSLVAPGSNYVYGVDGNFAFYRNVYFNTYLAQSQTRGRAGDDLSYRAQLVYNADRYGLALDRMVVEPNFNPEVGLLRREDFQRSFIQGRFSPRPNRNPIVRKYTTQASLEYITNNKGHLESRAVTGHFETEFQAGYTATAQYERLYESVAVPFSISRGVKIPAGNYEFQDAEFSLEATAQHRLAGTGTFNIGSFYNGNKKTASFKGRVAFGPHLGIEPNVSFNWINLPLPQAPLTVTLLGTRTTFTVSPRMFVAALVQYSSSNTSFSTNLRFRWEYRPGSEFFIVYTEGRSTLPVGHTDLESRGISIKLTRLFRF